NNHALDGGREGLKATLHAVEEAGLLPVGGEAGTALIENNALRVVVSAHDLSSGVPKDLSSELSAARELGDVLVVTFHVDGPPSYLPSTELREAVELSLEQGARAIASHGTHALGPVERRKDAVIAWG